MVVFFGPNEISMTWIEQLLFRNTILLLNTISKYNLLQNQPFILWHFCLLLESKIKWTGCEVGEREGEKDRERFVSRDSNSGHPKCNSAYVAHCPQSYWRQPKLPLLKEI